MAEVVLRFPEVRTVLRPTGEAVVELRQNGEVVGELNFSKLLTNWVQQIVTPTPPKLGPGR